jgi:DNA-binding NarL/FixJ family response regulator
MANLTSREQQVLDELLLGNTQAEIAKHLAITPDTVRNHVVSILAKHNEPTTLKLVCNWYREAIGLD